MKWLLLILLIPSVAAVQFTEIMYDPPGADNNLEYLEVVANQSLEGWKIADLNSNDTLTLLQEGEGDISLIVEEGFNTTGFNCPIYSAGSSIGNNLNNGGDSIFLYHNGTLVATTTFNDSKAHDNGFSWQWNGSWQEGVPTPCEYSKLPSVEINSSLINETNCTEILNETHINITVENLTAPSSDQNISVESEQPEQITCSVSIELQDEKMFYESKEGIKFKNNVEGTDEFNVTYTITTLFGKLVRNTTTNNENIKSFTPNIDGEMQVFVLRSTLASNCGDDEDQKILIVRGEQKIVVEQDPLINIISLDKDEYSAGGIVKVTVNVTRAATAKSVIELWIEQDGKKVSETTAMTVMRDGIFAFAIPIVLKDDLDDGMAVLRVEGLDSSDEREVKLVKKNKEKKKEYTITEEPITITNFRTNHKKPAKEINLYATLTGNGKYIARLRTLEGFEDEIVEVDGKENYKKAIQIKEGQNVFLLELLQDNETLASASLFLEVTAEKIEQVEFFSSQTVQATPIEQVAPTENAIIAALDAPPEVQSYEQESSVIYLPYLLGAAAMIVGIIAFVSLRTRKEKQ